MFTLAGKRQIPVDCGHQLPRDVRKGLIKLQLFLVILPRCDYTTEAKDQRYWETREMVS
jgi:hypothetical protein